VRITVSARIVSARIVSARIVSARIVSARIVAARVEPRALGTLPSRRGRGLFRLAAPRTRPLAKLLPVYYRATWAYPAPPVRRRRAPWHSAGLLFSPPDSVCRLFGCDIRQPVAPARADGGWASRAESRSRCTECHVSGGVLGPGARWDSPLERARRQASLGILAATSKTKGFAEERCWARPEALLATKEKNIGCQR
jgi:hypothetical protein